MSGLVWRASAAMWALSLVMSTNGNVLPQLYFQRVAPAHKLTWLALSLLCATIASIAGVLASRQRLGRSARGPLVALVVAFAAEAALPLAPSATAFVLLASAAQFTVNFSLNALDHAAIDALGDARGKHDRASTGARLLGMLAAPLIAPNVIDHGLALSALFVALGVATVVGARAVLRYGVRGTPAQTKATLPQAELSGADRAVLAYAASVYVALYLVAANLIYLLRDVAHVARAERVGGVTLTVVFTGALLGAGLRAKVLSTSDDPPRVGHLLAPAPWLALVAGVLCSGWRVPLGALLGGGLALGLAYGVFLAALREYVARPRVDATRGALLSAFNNLANGSSLVAFALLALASSLARGRAYTAVMTLAALLPFVGSAWLTRVRRA